MNLLFCRERENLSLVFNCLIYKFTLSDYTYFTKNIDNILSEYIQRFCWFEDTNTNRAFRSPITWKHKWLYLILIYRVVCSYFVVCLVGDTVGRWILSRDALNIMLIPIYYLCHAIKPSLLTFVTWVHVFVLTYHTVMCSQKVLLSHVHSK